MCMLSLQLGVPVQGLLSIMLLLVSCRGEATMSLDTMEVARLFSILGCESLA